MKKVLHVIGGLKRGGAETMIMNFYKNIDRTKLQFDFLIFYKVGSDYEKMVEKMGGKLILVLPPKGINYFGFVKSVRSAIKKYGQYDAIHCHVMFNSAFSLLAAKLEKIPICIVHSHSAPQINNFSIEKKIYCFITKNIINMFANKFLACSKEAAKALYKKNKMKQVIYLRNAINVEEFLYPNKIEQINFINENNINKNYFNIVSVARFHPVKNHKFMLKIAKILYDNDIKFKLYLVGDGDLKEEIKNIVIKYKLENNVSFLGVRKDISIILSTMDIFIMPSFYEGLPVSLIEAQTAGLKCLVSEKVSKEVDMNLNSIEFLSINNPNDWVEAIKKIIYTKEKVDKRIIEKTITANGYNIKNQVNKLYDIYEI